jgi:hypothetical protein
VRPNLTGDELDAIIAAIREVATPADAAAAAAATGARATSPPGGPA